MRKTYPPCTRSLEDGPGSIRSI